MNPVELRGGKVVGEDQETVSKTKRRLAHMPLPVQCDIGFSLGRMPLVLLTRYV